MTDRHVIVIGAGAIGLCSAWELRQRGVAVTVLDAGARDDPNCSYGNAGFIVPSHVVPLAAPGMVALGLRNLVSRSGPFGISPGRSPRRAAWMLSFARHCTERNVAHGAPILGELLLASRAHLETLLADAIPDVPFHRDGLLMLSATEASFEEERHAAVLARPLGIEADVVGRSEIAALEPDVEIEAAGGVFYRSDAFLEPERYMAALRDATERSGVTTRYGTRATAIRTNRGRVVAVRHGDTETGADAVVVAAGSWSAGLLRPLGVRLPLEAGRGHSFDLPSPPAQIRHGLLLMEARIAVNPAGGRVRFAGTMELSGLSDAVNARRVDGMRESIERYLPQFTPRTLAADETTSAWAGLRPCSPDGLPYIGRTARTENLVVATGHAMLGMSLSAITGRLVAQVATGEEPQIALDAFSPDRFDRRSR